VQQSLGSAFTVRTRVGRIATVDGGQSHWPRAGRRGDCRNADLHPQGKATAVPAAAAADAHAHFSARLAVETDCADVAVDLAAGTMPYTVLDVRGPHSYAAGHVPAR
jgi:hypothetical protein